MRLIRAAGVLFCLALLAPMPSHAVSALPVTRGAASPVDAVKSAYHLLRYGGPRRCRTQYYWRCGPVTPRLDRRLLSIERYGTAHHMNSSIDVFGRTQNYALHNIFRLLFRRGTVASVQWVQIYNPSPSGIVRLTWIVKRGPTGWLLDDSFCSGRPSTDFYRNADVVPCV